MFVFDNGTLWIRNVRKEEHGGNFHCEASDSVGRSVKGKVLVTVSRPPEIAPFAFPAQMEVGARLQVTCSVFSGDFPLTISWLKDGLQIPTNLSVTEHNTALASSLLFMEVKNEHSGSYICRASNHASSSSFSAVLQMKASPKWVLEPFDVEVVRGNIIRIPCFARGYPETRVSWYKIGPDGRTATNVLSLSKSYGVLRNGTLIVSKTAEHHDESLRCDVENDSKEKLSKTIRLRIKSPPKIFPMATNITVLVGKPLGLICDVEGELPVKIQWTVNGVSVAADRWKFQVSEVETGHKRKRSRLAVTSFSRDDAGLYACTGSNQIGKDTIVFTVTAISLPDPPRQIRVSEKTSRSFTLKWDHPSNSDEQLEDYVVEWQLRGDDTWFNQSVSSSQVTVSGLAPAKTYLVKISSKNSLGIGTSTGLTTLDTLLEAPSIPPSNVQVSFTTERSLRARWKEIVNETDSQLLGYLIRWNAPKDPQKRFEKSISASSSSITLEDLEPSTRYEISVAAFNGEGAGPDSPTVSGFTHAEETFPVIDEVHCLTTSSQSLRVKWRAPAVVMAGATASYRVYFRKVNAPTGPETKRSSNLETVLHGLEPATTYSVRVAVASKTDVGPASKAISCTTKEEAPRQIEMLIVVSSDGGGVKCVWMPPKFSTPETNYKLHYRLQGSEKDMIVNVQQTRAHAELFHEVSSLQVGLKYDFWVQALSSYGEGPPSAIATTVPTAKARPKIVSKSHSFRVQSQTSISLPCKFVGAELIATNWYFGSQRITLSAQRRLSKNQANDLIIKEVSSSDAGNYTCVLEKDGIKEIVIHQLEVYHPPSSPFLILKLVTERSLTVSWTLEDDGCSSVTAFIFSFRKSGDAWEEIEIEPFRLEYALKDLNCGTYYELKIRATNDVGIGPSSPAVNVKTLGNVPELPRPDQLVHSVKGDPHLLLYNWVDAGCPIQKFVVKAKQRISTQWSVLYDVRIPATQNSANALPGTVSLWLLNPKQHDVLQVVAYSNAGIKLVDFEVNYQQNVTTGLAMLQTLSEIRSAPENYQAGLNLQTLIPIACGIVTTIACISLCIIFTYLRRMGLLGRSGSAPKTSSITNIQRNSNANPFYSGTISSEEKLSTGSSDNRIDGDYEINPYATFNLTDIKNQWPNTLRDTGTISTAVTATVHDTLEYGNVRGTLQSNPPPYRTLASYAVTQIHNWDSDDSQPYVKPSGEKRRRIRCSESERNYQEGISVISQSESGREIYGISGEGSTVGSLERRQGKLSLPKKSKRLRQWQRPTERDEYSINV